MPQNPVFVKAPILRVQNCFPANGTIRSLDQRIEYLYQTACHWIGQPCLLEGIFRLACLVKARPAEEPVTGQIYNAIRESDNGSFGGTAAEQIHKARAAFALYEYNTDRSILKRIALWLRYLEIEFDAFTLQDDILYKPADLMELLVRFYQVTGVKTALRLCVKLRASAFDWTSALHTFQQSIPVPHDPESENGFCLGKKPEEIDYDEKEKLINYAEMLADGMRFTMYSGLFSGHSQELSSGRTVWNYLKKHHSALCGGTTANPFLCGQGADKPVDNRALAAWIEAFAAQMVLGKSEWAIEELVRIVFNGLDDCLEKGRIRLQQRINTIGECPDVPSHEIDVYARITRAAATAIHHAVSLTEEGIRINYMIPARILVMICRQPVILNMSEQSVVFQCKSPFSAPVDFFISRTGSRRISIIRAGNEDTPVSENGIQERSCFIHTEEEWKERDGFRVETDTIHAEETHHQGLCFLSANRLLCLPADKESYNFVACSIPVYTDGRIMIQFCKTDKWRLKNDIPCDIPVMPSASKVKETAEMAFYHRTPNRISMFPKVSGICLK